MNGFVDRLKNNVEKNPETGNPVFTMTMYEKAHMNVSNWNIITFVAGAETRYVLNSYLENLKWFLEKEYHYKVKETSMGGLRIPLPSRNGLKRCVSVIQHDYEGSDCFEIAYMENEFIIYLKPCKHPRRDVWVKTCTSTSSSEKCNHSDCHSADVLRGDKFLVLAVLSSIQCVWN